MEPNQHTVHFKDRIVVSCSAGSYCHIGSQLYVPIEMVSREDGRCTEVRPLGFEGDGFFVNSGGNFYHRRECWVNICEED